MDVANGQVRKVWQGIALLAQQPTAGKPVPQYGEGLCVVTAGKYLLYYHRRKGAVWIVQILAGERDQRRAFSSVKG